MTTPSKPSPKGAAAKRRGTATPGDSSKPTISVRWPIQADSILAGGDGAAYRVSPLDADDVMRAMDDLGRSLGVQPGNWMQLAITLAIKGRHILVEKETGAVERWNEGLYVALWAEVSAWCAVHGVGVKPCTGSSEFLQQWKDRSGEGDTPGTLRRKYYEASTKSGVVMALKSLAEQTGADLPVEHLRGLAAAGYEQSRLHEWSRNSLRSLRDAIQPPE